MGLRYDRTGHKKTRVNDQNKNKNKKNSNPLYHEIQYNTKLNHSVDGSLADDVQESCSEFLQ